ncbi:MAG: hypothetical protein HQL56_18215 [Magnetococcales bacterium]|nr:hypothetical protein [Magnetococcales bacterium]
MAPCDLTEGDGMSVFNDEPTLEIAELGYEVFAGQVRRMLLDVGPPFSVTLGGRWGAGKTSMLMALHESLKPNNTSLGDNAPEFVCPVWFNPWQYQGESNPMVPLLHEIRQQIGLWRRTYFTLEKTTEQMVDVGIKALGAFIDSAGLLGMGRRTAHTLVSGLEKAADQHRRNSFAEPLMAQKFQEEFEKAIQAVIGGKSEEARLVIFIDDLDRCADSTVFALLESIKLFLSSKACVFVFALDRVHVETAVARAGNYSSAEAADYVDKLFQARLHLPQPDERELSRFIDCLLRKGGLEGFFSSGTILPLLPHNPRVIKNFLNSLIALRPLMGLQPGEDNQPALLVHWLRCFAPDVYELLANEGEGVKKSLVEFCLTPHTANSLFAFFHRSLSSPLLTQEEKKDPLKEEEYRLLRTRVWREGAIWNFRRAFSATFEHLGITTYLI